MKNSTLSPRFVLTVLAVLVTCLGILEWRALYALDHPPLHHTDCVTCHSDAKTMQAMADKAGDQLYLVHSGQLTQAKFDSLRSKPSSNVSN